MSWERLQEAILSTASSTAMIFFIILAAGIYNNFLSLTQLPQSTAAWVGEQGFSPWLVLTLVLLMYLLFGCIMDSLSMVLLTVPIVFPIVSVLDFDMSYNDFGLWFGILVLIVVEVGLITPPVGLNLLSSTIWPKRHLFRDLSGRFAFCCHRPYSGCIFDLFPFDHPLACLGDGRLEFCQVNFAGASVKSPYDLLMSAAHRALVQ